MTKEKYIDNIYIIHNLKGLVKKGTVTFEWTFGSIKYEVYTHYEYITRTFEHDVFKTDRSGNVKTAFYATKLKPLNVNEIPALPPTVRATLIQFEKDARC